MEHNNPSNQTVSILKNYINLKVDIVLLSISQKMANAASYLVFAIIMGFLVLFISLFLSLSLASWLADVLNMPGMGNLIVGLIYIILGFILYIFREKIILGPVRNSMSKAMDFSDLHNESSIEKNENLEDAIAHLNDSLRITEESIDENFKDIQEYYSYDQMKDRFLKSIYENPKSILNTLLIIRELYNYRKKKKKQ